MEDSVGAAASPYEVLIVHVNIGVVGGAAPSAALTPQKRGPSPHLSGWLGRLPICMARPRRGFLATLWIYCMSFLDAVFRRMI